MEEKLSAGLCEGKVAELVEDQEVEASEGTLLHKSGDGRSSPIPGQTYPTGLCEGYAERGAAVHDGDADLKFCDLAIEVPRHEALTQKFHAVHPIAGKTIPGSFSGPAHISTRLRRWYPLPLSPQGAAQILRCPQSFVACNGASGDGLPGLRIPARRDDGMCATLGDGVMAFAGVVGTFCRDAADLFILRDLVEQVEQVGQVGRTGASPMWLPVISTARISNVCRQS